MKIWHVVSLVTLIVVGVPSYGRSPAEMEAWYRQSGFQDHQIQIMGEVVAPVGRELHNKARFESALGFRSLKIGSVFPVRSAQSPTGYSVRQWHFGVLPSSGTDRTPSGEDAFECWSQNAEIFVTCTLVQGDKLAVAFGQRLRETGVFLSRPDAGFDPVFDPAHMGTEPVVVGIILTGAGEELAKVALTYFSELYGKKPLVSHGDKQVNIGPGSEDCKRVNGKRLSDLTTQDLRIRKACAAPINDLLALASSKKTTYVFSSPMGFTDISVEKSGFGGVHVSIIMLHPKFPELTRRATLAGNAAMEEYNQRQKARKMKDF